MPWDTIVDSSAIKGRERVVKVRVRGDSIMVGEGAWALWNVYTYIQYFCGPSSRGSICVEVFQVVLHSVVDRGMLNAWGNGQALAYLRFVFKRTAGRFPSVEATRHFRSRRREQGRVLPKIFQ
jgi:hypothetical protein